MNSALRNRFHSDGVASISQERLLLALYERVLVDLDRSAAAIARRDPAEAHENLVHAQQIIEELHLALDPEAWDGADRLASLYLYTHDRLVEANLRKDLAVVLEVKQIIEPLAATWREAYEKVSGTRSATAASPQPAGVGGRFEFGA